MIAKIKKYKSAILPICLLLIIPASVYAEDLRRIVQLEGNWKFSIGDLNAWSAPNFDDSNWDNIRVPSTWENNGYRDYNGFAWYRRTFRISSTEYSGPLFLIFGRIDDADEVYINGKLLAKSGSMPPNYMSAYDDNRRYIIPEGLLKENSTNTIAVRVYDGYRDGGITGGPVGIYIDEDNALLDYDLSGMWKYHLGDNKQWREANYNDEIWDEIPVPSDWEKQGYANYDGYAWYRKEFYLPSDLRNENLYLCLGKIDDYDDVYLNGKHIGSVFDLDKDGEYRRKGYEYNARRIYKIPGDALNRNGKNVLAIRVYDKQWRGGIYEGPIGLMREENKKMYERRHYRSQPFWDYVIDQFIEY